MIHLITDTLANTIRESGGWEYCNKQKEGFKRGNPISLKILRKCIMNNQLVTHIKPNHVSENKKSSVWDVGKFFKSAAKAGFGTVVASFRRNQVLNLLILVALFNIY